MHRMRRRPNHKHHYPMTEAHRVPEFRLAILESVACGIESNRIVSQDIPERCRTGQLSTLYDYQLRDSCLPTYIGTGLMSWSKWCKRNCQNSEAALAGFQQGAPCRQSCALSTEPLHPVSFGRYTKNRWHGDTFYLVSMPWEVKYLTQGVNVYCVVVSRILPGQ